MHNQIYIIILILFINTSYAENQSSDATVCSDAKFECPYGNSVFSVPMEYQVLPPSCDYTDDNSITSEMFKQCAQPCCKQWPSRVNGCSVPTLKGVTKAAKIFADSRFVGPCNMHDLCYSAPNAKKANCDNEFLTNMEEVCSTSFFKVDPEFHICNLYSEAIFEAVHLFAGSAFDKDQKYAESSCDLNIPDSKPGAELLYGQPINLHIPSPKGEKSLFLMLQSNQYGGLAWSPSSPSVFYVRPYDGGKGSGCVKYGDPVRISEDPAIKNQCGDAGCRVAKVHPNNLKLFFDHGSNVSNPLYFRGGEEGKCLTYDDVTVINATNNSGNTSNCGRLGCRVLQRNNNNDIFFAHGNAPYPETSGFVMLNPAKVLQCPY